MSDPQADVQPRRRPKQERSRERVEAILLATRKLVGDRGNDAVSVREIAAEAGVPIGSVYQYFPDKNAILRMIIVDYLEVLQSKLAKVLSDLRAPSDVPGAIDAMVDVMIRVHKREPAIGTIWSAIQANTVLRDLDWADAREMAQFLTGAFRQVLPGADPDDVYDACLYAAHTVPLTIRIAHVAPKKDGERMIRELRHLLRLRADDLISRG